MASETLSISLEEFIRHVADYVQRPEAKLGEFLNEE